MESEDARKKIAATWGVYGESYVLAAMSDVNALLQIESNRELFHKVRDWIVVRRCQPMEAYEAYRHRLSEGERYVMFAWSFVVETTNGGVHQYLTNSSGDLAEETLSVMHAIGATLAAEVLDAARNTFFGDKPIPADRKLRNDILSAWDARHGKGAANEFLNRFDGELGHCESVDDAIAKYIRNHPEMFSHSEERTIGRAENAVAFDKTKADETLAMLESMVRRKRGQS